MSGKSFDDDDQHRLPLAEIFTLAFGWTRSLIYSVTMHLLLVAVEIYLFWPLLSNYPHEWGDNVIGMAFIQYVSGLFGFTPSLPELPTMFGLVSHLFGNVVIVMILAHTVSHHIVLWIAIPSSLWFGSVFLFNFVNSVRIVRSLKVSTIESRHHLLS